MKEITDNHYVDDYLDSFASIVDAAKTVNEIMTIHDKAYFFYETSCQILMN